MCINQLQTIMNNKVHNHHPFGRELQAFCHQNSVLSLLPGCDFMDGGCYALATALTLFLDKFKCTYWIAGRENIADHAVVRVERLNESPIFLDSDGMATEKELITKMQVCESTSTVSLRPVKDDELNSIQWLSYEDIGLPKQLHSLMSDHFGYITQNQLSDQHINSKYTQEKLSYV